MPKTRTIAFIGAGNMARAIIAGLLQNGYSSDHIWATSPHIKEREHFQKNLIIHITSDNVLAAEKADVVVFGVKPNMLQTVCAELETVIHHKKPLLISLAAGVKTETIATWSGSSDSAIVRTMPNIASAVGAGATGLFANPAVTEAQRAIVESLFRSVGTTVWTEKEEALDIITTISGSGPAYLFYFFEAMQNAAEAMGFDKDQAKLLIAQTATGAAKMVMETDEPFNQLRRWVTSEKGTTAAATNVFDQHHLPDIVKEAMTAAFKRAKELSQ